jgi:hypothetical protein
MRRQLLSEILEEASKLPTIAQKVEHLRAHNTPALRQLLLAAYDPDFEFDTAIPPYRQNAEVPGCAGNNLYIEHRRLYIFRKGYTAVTSKRKTAILGQILESIDVTDALLLEKVINKDLSEYGLSVEAINTAFPNLVPTAQNGKR